MNIIRIVFTADTHLGFDYPLRPKGSTIHRGKDFFQNFERILQFAVKQNIQYVVHGGDLFFRSKVPAAIIDKVYMLLHKYLDVGLTLIVVPGNHERSALPRSLLAAHPRLFVFEKPSTFLFQINGVRLSTTGFPNIRDDVRSHFPAVLSQTDWRQPADIRLLIMHQAVEGATVGSHNFTFRHHPDVIQMRDIPAAFHAVLCGHIHRRQTLYRPGTVVIPVMYPGSIERTSFAEKNEPKGFLDISILKNRPAESVQITETFIPLPSRPMHDIILPEDTTEKTILPYLQFVFEKLPSNAIIKIKPRSHDQCAFVSLLSTNRLRQIARDGMIIQLHSTFYKPAVHWPGASTDN